MNILVIQNSEIDPIGVLGEALVSQGAQLCTWLPEQHPTGPEGDYAGLVILGGHMNAHEDEKYPHLPEVVRLIRQFYAENKPIMGVCLGAQLIARAFGSKVSAHTVPELGFSPIKVTDAVRAGSGSASFSEPWLSAQATENLHIMQWHFDSFDLPPQADLLMTNPICKHQAYRIGRNIYGFQFHLEVTPEIVNAWLAAKQDWIAANRPGLDQQIKQQIEDYSQQSMQFANSVAKAWIQLV